MNMGNTRKTVPPKETKITDLQVAAFLLARDHSLLRTEGDSGPATFVFGDVCESEVLAFYQKNATVHPRKILDAFRNLKGLLFERERGGR